MYLKNLKKVIVIGLWCLEKSNVKGGWVDSIYKMFIVTRVIVKSLVYVLREIGWY